MGKIKIAVLGPGAIGGLLAALFWKEGLDVICIDKDENVSSLAQKGIELQSNFFGYVAAKPKIRRSLDSKPDVLFITAKAPFLARALEKIDAKYLENSLIIPLLNGVEHMVVLKEKFGNNVIAGTIGSVEAYSRELGRVTHSSQGAPSVTLFAGSNDWQKEQVKKVAKLLRQIGLEVATMDNENNVLWQKFLRLSALAAVTAASGEDLGFVRSNPGWKSVLENYVKETLLVARADGAAGLAWKEALEHLYKLPAVLKSSLARDLAAGRPSELDALIGAVLRRGQKFGIAMPTIQSTLNVIKKKYNV